MEIGSIIENLFQSTPPREGGDRSCLQPLSKSWIFQSTPPRKGGDETVKGRKTKKHNFNPRPPARGATAPKDENLLNDDTFQSTPPREGGDDGRQVQAPAPVGHFNPRPPARGATFNNKVKIMTNLFQSTPPREGGDDVVQSKKGGQKIFQSTPPARGATWLDSWFCCRSWYFNPRPPRGGRH